MSDQLMISVSPRITPTQIDDFGPSCERSVRGAVHFLPRSTIAITSDELDHIRAKYPDLAAELVILTKVGQSTPEKAAVPLAPIEEEPTPTESKPPTPVFGYKARGRNKSDERP